MYYHTETSKICAALLSLTVNISYEAIMVSIR